MSKSGNKVMWFHRARSVFWAILGAVSFLLGWQNNVALVWVASLYANIVSDWTAAEASDNRDLHEKLDKIIKMLEERDGTASAG